MRARVVVVGGGVAGLTATADLARAGLPPVLLEAAPQLGGRAQTRVIDGYAFNQGPHALYPAGAFKAALDDFGVTVSGGQPDIPGGLALWSDSAYPWPVRPRGEAAPPLDDGDRASLAAELRRVSRGDYDGHGQPLSAVTGALAPRVRALMEALVRVSSYVHAPDLLDARAALDQMRLSFAGVIYIDGGWSRLVEGLATVARAAGARLRTEARVNTVMREEGGWRVDVTGEASISCDAVILAVPPSDATQIAPSSKTLAALSSDLQPARIMGLDLALSRGLRPRTDFALGMTAPTYMSVHSAVASLAPEGGALIHLARYLAPDEAPRSGFAEELENLAKELAPGWRSHEVRRQRLVGLTVSHDIPRWRTGGRRAGVRVADAQGLYLAGDWIGEEGMLADAAAASARVAAAEAKVFLSGAAPA